MDSLTQKVAAQSDPKEIISEAISRRNLDFLIEILKNCM